MVRKVRKNILKINVSVRQWKMVHNVIILICRTILLCDKENYNNNSLTKIEIYCLSKVPKSASKQNFESISSIQLN